MKIYQLSLKDVKDFKYAVEVDGSVNKNPGQFGLVGIHEPKTNDMVIYKYKGEYLTNQLMEMLAIYHGLEYLTTKYNDIEICTVISDSLSTINILSNQSTVKNERLKYLKIAIENDFDLQEVYLVHRRGHTRRDYVGKRITYLMRNYNRMQLEPDLPYGSLQTYIEQLQW